MCLALLKLLITVVLLDTTCFQNRAKSQCMDSRQQVDNWAGTWQKLENEYLWTFEREGQATIWISEGFVSIRNSVIGLNLSITTTCLKVGHSLILSFPTHKFFPCILSNNFWICLDTTFKNCFFVFKNKKSCLKSCF